MVLMVGGVDARKMISSFDKHFLMFLDMCLLIMLIFFLIFVDIS